MATRRVRIDEDDKVLLEKLRCALGDASGDKPTQQETLGAALAFAWRRRDEFVSESAWKPLTARQFQAWIDDIEGSEGFEATPPDQIDDIAYGDG
ncbi:MAG: hypothetical protein LC624_06080 [Halobacteriales archaeon]|nr:hypothetical protein [Halobacteriales archaeon]